MRNSRMSPREQKLMEYALSQAAKGDLDTANKYSRIYIEIAVAKLGKYEALETWLSSQELAPGYTALKAWKSATVIRDDFDGFGTYYPVALAALGIDKETGDAILEQCRTK